MPDLPQPAPSPFEPPPKRSSAGIAWLVAVVVATGGITAFYSARSDLGEERIAHTATQVTLHASRIELETLEKRISELEAERAALAEEAKAKAEEARLKAEALAAMFRTQEELQDLLEAEIAKGSVLISQQRGELVVDLIDQVVFDSGEAELNARGKAVLRQVGETLARVPDKIIQVSGHTDRLKISKKLSARFPTNWELSAARATHVVRYLQDEIGLPGDRLVAAGLAEFRPIASNRTRSGRSRNRRIEVRLLALPTPRESRATAAR
ncbi:flagellar motor protein MotB [Vulgatibacter sp.]|uniref:OmpA/MotB family protein n=1 Tax=Vulgatibacter sp. TaxID=1971226 RepID=UPI00356466A2